MFGSVEEPEMKLMGQGQAMLLDAAAPQIPLDLIMKKAVEEAKLAGTSPENAALIVAALTYFSGAAAKAGVPMANRKLGAMARMHAGASRTSGIALVTNKFTHRIPAFSAYKAVYEELLNKKLTKVDGAVLPPFIAGGAIYGYSALGEDVNFPELAKNAAKVGTEAMIRAMEGAGVRVAEFLSMLDPHKAYLAVPTRPPAENVKGASLDFILEAKRVFDADVELLVEPESGEFAIKSREDVLSIASVHSLRRDTLERYLRKLNLRIEDLMDELEEVEFNSLKYYKTKNV